eukprot:2889168-Lingulodinium_polyedra.AAC.1
MARSHGEKAEQVCMRSSDRLAALWPARRPSSQHLLFPPGWVTTKRHIADQFPAPCLLSKKARGRTGLAKRPTSSSDSS